MRLLSEQPSQPPAATARFRLGNYPGVQKAAVKQSITSASGKDGADSCLHLRECTVVPDVAFMREDITDKACLALFHVLLDGIQRLFRVDLSNKREDDRLSFHLKHRQLIEVMETAPPKWVKSMPCKREKDHSQSTSQWVNQSINASINQ